MKVTLNNTTGLDVSGRDGETFIFGAADFEHRILQLLEAITLPEPDWEGSLTIVSSCLAVFRIINQYGVDNDTKAPLYWESRPWMLSDKQDNGELLRTVWLAFCTAVEHENRERFLYQGERVMDPHFKLEDALEAARAKRLRKAAHMSNVEAGAKSAASKIKAAETDLGTLSHGQRLDLLMDQFPQWDSAYINEVLAFVQKNNLDARA